MADKRKHKSASLGCLFWIAFILLVLVLFFFNRKNISMVLEKTGAMHLITGKETPGEDAPLPAGQKIPPIATAADDGSAELQADSTEEPIKPATEEPVAEKPADTASEPAPEKPAPTAKPAVKPAAEKPAVQTRTATLFFVTIDSDGRVLRKEVTRDVPRTDSPLSETLSALFSGPNGAESSRNLRSLIPNGTRLLSASVKDGVATLNLSEEFQFNQFGIEGYLGQLAQIVFTATAFPTVSSVQILIEGQRREYLGAEGVWIGTPLSREKF